MQKSSGTRIDSLLEVLNISQLEFAKRLNVTSGAVTNWKKRQLGINVINKIVDAFPQISREWLMTGEGSPLKVNQIVNNAFTPTGDKKHDAILERLSQTTYKASNKNNGIPLIPTSAMAGALGGDSITINQWDVEDFYVIPAFKKSDFCIRVDGDSMQPKYLRGDILACTRVPLSNLWFQWGKIYIIDTRQGVLVKHVEKGSDNDHIKLVSDNPDYKPFEIPTSELFGLAIVNGVIRVE